MKTNLKNCKANTQVYEFMIKILKQNNNSHDDIL